MTLHEELSALKREIKTRGKPLRPNKGICYYVSVNYIGLLTGLFLEWPHYSGSFRYPVPHPTLPPLDGYWDTFDLWDPETEYGRLRLDLLDFLIKETKPC